MSVFTIRAHKRFAVCRKIRLRKQRRRGIDGLLIELSLDGCCISNIDAPAGFAIEDRVILSVAGTSPIEGRVRWLSEGTIGLRFARPLHNAALEDLIRLCRETAETARAYGT